MLNRISIGWLAVGVAVFAAGCGDSFPMTPVEGTVRLDGKPLAGVEVSFAPAVNAESKSPPFSRDITDENGHYTLKCDNNKLGAAVGSHVVTVRRPVLIRRPDEPASKAKGPNVPLIYQSLNDTPLKIEVKPDQKVYDLELKSKKSAKSSGM